MKHARKAAMESIVLSIASQTVRMIRVTMCTERVPVNLAGKDLTAAKVNNVLWVLFLNSICIEYFSFAGSLPNV